MRPQRAIKASNRLAPTFDERMVRIQSDLRMGLPCHISSDDDQAVVIASEKLTQARLDALRELFGVPELVLTANRASAVLMQSAFDAPLRIVPPVTAGIDWFAMLADAEHDNASMQFGPLHPITTGDTTLPTLALKLMKFAQLIPAAVIFRLPRLAELPADLQIAQIDTSETAAYFARSPDLSVASSANLPLHANAAGKLLVFRDPNGINEHMALVIGNPNRAHSVMCRVHSACFTGDVLGSLKCDCGPQLHAALDQMGSEGAGVLLYLNQEGRGIGLANKMRVYDLQSQGFDTVEANHKLGFEDDERDFRVASVMLRTLGYSAVRLLTNNPAKVATLQQHGTTVSERLPLKVGKNRHNSGYLSVKALKSGHAL